MPIRKKLKILKCASCGADVEIHNPRSKFIYCPYCGTPSDFKGILPLIANAKPENVKALSFLTLGMIGHFESIAYKIIGRKRCTNNYYEYDKSDNQYYNEKWQFDEWILLSDEGNYKTIIEDKEGFYFSQTIVPQYPGFDKNNRIEDFVNKESRQVTEYGISTIDYFEGESTYLINLGDSSQFVQYRYKNKDYSIEWRLKEEEIYEIEFFEETPIDRFELANFFKGEPAIESLLEKHITKQKARKRIRIFVVLLGLIDICLAIFYMGNFFSPASYDFGNIPFTDLTFLPQNDTTFTADYKLAKKFYINNSISSFRLHARTYSWPENSELTLFWTILNTKNDTLAFFRDDFYQKKIRKNKKVIKYARKFSMEKFFSTQAIEDSLHFEVKFIVSAKKIPKFKRMSLIYSLVSRATEYKYTYVMLILGFIVIIFGFKIQ